MSDRVVQFEWVLPEGERVQAIHSLEALGGDVQRSGEPFRPNRADPVAESGYSSFEPLVVVVTLLGVVRLLDQLETLWRDTRRKGRCIVDVRETKVRYIPLPDESQAELWIVGDEHTSVHHCESSRELRERVERAIEQQR